MKRWISLLLVMTMMFSPCVGISITAFADGQDESTTPVESSTPMETALEESEEEAPALEESEEEAPEVEEPEAEDSSAEAAQPEKEAAKELDGEKNAVEGKQGDSADVITRSAEPEGEEPVAGESDEGDVPLLRDTKASSSGNLVDFITYAEIDAPTNADGAYIVEAGTPYSIELRFHENSDLQFNDVSMTYNIPKGIDANGHQGTIQVSIEHGGQTYTISNNPYKIENGVLTLTWNQSDPNYSELTAAANVGFSLTFSGVFDETETIIRFSDDIEKKIEITGNSKVTTTKDATVVIQDDRVNYTATVESFGTSKNVVVTDTITGTGLTLDPSSIQFTSSTGQPVSATGSANGNSFSYTIPSMADQEVVTITYSAIIDPSQLQMVNGKVVTQSGNTIKAVSDKDPEGHSTHIEKEISYTPAIYKNVANELVDQQDGTVKKLQWTIFVNGDQYGNNPPKVSAAGTEVTDTINEGDRDIMKYSGTGITVRVTDAQGRPVRTDTIPYSQLDAYSDYSWKYTIPQSDAGHAYRYEITYTTDVETKDLTLWRQLGNVVVTNGGESDWGSGEVIPDNGVIDINKTVMDIDKNSMKVSWETIVDVPKTGLPRAVVYDVYPTATSKDGATLVEEIIPSSLEITGLQDGEAYTINYNGSYDGKAAMIITFTNNGQPGLRGTGETRQIKITYQTEIDPTWLEEAGTDDGMAEHLNIVVLDYIGTVFDYEYAYIRPFKVEKYGEPVATRTVDGVELPVYRYEITLTGVESDSITITDEFDTELLELYDGGEDDRYMFGGERLDNLYAQGYEQVPYQNIEGGVRFTVTPGSRQIRKLNDNRYFTYYKFVYYVTVKDADALEELGLKAIENGGVYDITNTATWEGETDTTTVAYAYNGLDKKLLTSEEDLHTDSGDVYAEFSITVNPAAAKLNGGQPITMTDTVSNLSVDITSIKAEPSDGVSWDMSGNTVTYTIPDETKVVITYRTRVLFTSSGALVTSFNNRVEMLGYHDEVDGHAERETSGGGTGSIPRINLMKYEAGNMAKRLAGAKFQLLDANKQPVKGTRRNGVEVQPYDLIFVTDDNGMITVEGNQGRDGWTIQEDTRYYLREIEAPPKHMLAGFDYAFQVSSDGTTDYSQYIYHSGDTMSAKNYPGTDVQIEKEWTDGYENHESDTVTVKLQQKIGDGQWSDTIREEVKQSDGTYVWQDTSGKVLILNKDSDWKGTFSSLPLEVPDVIPVSDESEDVEVEYRIVETDVNGNTVDPDAGTYNGGTVTITKTSDTSYSYTITNSPSNGSLKIQKVVTENGSAVSSDAAKVKLAGDYTFTVYTDESCTTPLQKDGADVTVTLTIPDDGSSVTSEEITDIPAGTYYVKETSPTTSNPSPVTNPVEVTVEAGKTGEATVIATITNDYKYVEAAPEVNKSIKTWPKNVTSFDFTLTAGTNDAGVETPMPESGGENASATNTADPAVFGTIIFEVPGTYNYTIKEVVPEDDDPTTEGIQKDGVTYTETEYPVQIVVEVDSATGQLTTPVIKYGEALDQSSLTITNRYDAKGEAVFSAKKAANTNLGDRTFTFQLLDADDKLIETSDPVKQGETATFTTIEYVLADLDDQDSKEFTYKIREVIPEGATADNNYTVDGVKYDPTVVTTVVTVSDAGDGTLTVKYDGNEDFSTPEFKNDYDAKGEAVFKAKKAANTSLGDKTFKFQLLDEDDNVIETSAEVKQNETAVFTTIEYKLADLDGASSKDFTYQIREVIPEGATAENDYTVDGVKYDPTVVTTVVTVSDAGNGTLSVKYDGNETFSTPEFENDYDAKGKAVFSAKKAANTNLGDKTFKFQLLDADDNVLETSAEVKQNETASFNAIEYVLSDLEDQTSKEFTYKIREVIPEGATADNNYTVDGVKYDPTVVTTVVTVTDAGDGTLTVTYDGNEDFSTPEFKNDYDAKGKAVFSAKKAGNTKLGNKTFTFELLDADDKLIETSAEVKQNETAAFTTIEYKLADLDGDSSKEFTYKIREVIPEGATAENNYTVDGVKYDPTVVTTVVTVSDAGDGTLSVKYDGNESFSTPEFKNDYDAKGEAVFSAKKAGNDKLGDRTFTFQLLDADDKLIETSAEVKQGETAAFTTIEYELADLDGASSKDFTYKIREVIPEGATAENNYTVDGVKYDPTVVTTVVTVSDAGDGTLSVKYDGNESFSTPEFTNDYDAKGEAVFKAKKAGNAKLGNKTFTFELLDEDDKVIETSDPVKQGETATFTTIEYKLADLDDQTSKEFTYKIREVIPEGATAENNYTVDGVTYDPTVVTTVVTISDAGDGTLTVTYDGNETFSTPEFENDYDAKGEAVFKAKKAANTNLGDKTFTFELLDADDKVIETSDPVKQNETVTFTAIEYELADLDGQTSKDFTYKIREVIPEGATAENNYTVDGVTYDTKVVTTVVTVSDAGDGTLSVKYDGNETFSTPEFANTCDAEGAAVLSAKKAANSKLGDKTFTFELLDEDDNVIETSAAVKQNETVTFTAIEYVLSDLEDQTSKDFTYKIREVIPEEATAENNYTVDGVTYDTKVVTTVVTVTDAGDGTLTVTYDGNETFSTPEFENDYSAEGEAVIKAKKQINDWGKAKGFTFTLSAVDGAPMPEGSTGGKLAKQATKAKPEVVFGTIKYTEPGTYMYTIVETDDGIKDITYDTSTHYVVVTVTDPNKDGELVCKVEYDGKSSLTIVNRRGTKTGDDNPIQGLLLTFLLSLGLMMAITIGKLRRWRREQDD